MQRFVKILILSAAALSAAWSANAQIDTDQVWARANTSYTNGDYSSAINAYDSIVNEGYHSARLYYNLGNAYFKAGQNGKAIANYKRAQKLAPADKDIAYNLAYANSFVKDKIASVPQFFLSKWFVSVRNVCSSNTWAVLSLVGLAVALACTLLYLLSRSLKGRKTGFWLGVAFVILTVCSVAFAAAERREIIDSSSAVVLSTAAAVKSSPDASSKDIFILHEGTVVKILNRLGDWSEIEIADGNEGWIYNSSIEVI